MTCDRSPTGCRTQSFAFLSLRATQFSILGARARTRRPSREPGRQVKVFRQVTQHTFATIETVNDQYKLAIGEPGSDQGKHLCHQLRRGVFCLFRTSLRVGGAFFLAWAAALDFLEAACGGRFVSF